MRKSAKSSGQRSYDPLLAYGDYYQKTRSPRSSEPVLQLHEHEHHQAPPRPPKIPLEDGDSKHELQHTWFQPQEPQEPQKPQDVEVCPPLPPRLHHLSSNGSEHQASSNTLISFLAHGPPLPPRPRLDPHIRKPSLPSPSTESSLQQTWSAYSSYPTAPVSLSMSAYTASLPTSPRVSYIRGDYPQQVAPDYMRSSSSSPFQVNNPNELATSLSHFPSASQMQHTNNLHYSQTTLPISYVETTPTPSLISGQSGQESSLSSQLKTTTRARHDIVCTGCGSNPIRGEYRWHCVTCPNEDLCSNCRYAGVKSDHDFRPVLPWAEIHEGNTCAGCAASPIVGVRRECQMHKDESWCEECFRRGKCCQSPFAECRQSPLGLYLEQHGGLPLPAEWLGHIKAPPIAEYYLRQDSHEHGWLSFEGKRKFFSKATRDMAESKNSQLAVYSYDPEYVTYSLGSSTTKYKWTFKGAPPSGDDLDSKEKLWDYLLKIDSRTGEVVKEEFAEHYSDQCIPGESPVFHHGDECDSLVFTAPREADAASNSRLREFRWCSDRPVTTLNGNRWDAQQYALFERISLSSNSTLSRHSATLSLNNRGGGGSWGGVVTDETNTERLVADMAWWDGHRDAPEPVVCIRDATLDHSLALATLAVLHAHQWRVLALEKAKHPDEFRRAENTARLTSLGRQAYWRYTDNRPNPGAAGGGNVTRRDRHSGKKKTALMSLASLEVVANALEIVNKASSG